MRQSRRPRSARARTCPGRGVFPWSARPACGRTPRRRRSPATGPSPGAARRATWCGRTRRRDPAAPLDAHACLPGHRHRIDSGDPDRPLLPGQAVLRLVHGRRSPHRGARAARDERARVRRVLPERQERRPGRLLPDAVPTAGAAGQQQVMGSDVREHRARRADLQEGGDDQAQPVLHLLARIFDDPSAHVTHHADGHRHGPFAALGRGEQAGRHPPTPGRKVPFRHRALPASSGRAGSGGPIVGGRSPSDTGPFQPRTTRPFGEQDRQCPHDRRSGRACRPTERVKETKPSSSALSGAQRRTG
jgi:hypothetical protein